MRRLLSSLVIVAAGALLMFPAEGSADRKPPSVGFTTKDRAVLVSSPVPVQDVPVPTTVGGWAKDDRAGIRSVTVVYCPGSRDDSGGWSCGSTGSLGSLTVKPARLSCARARLSCSWSAALPTQPGVYLVFAKATDSARRTRSIGPLQVYVA